MKLFMLNIGKILNTEHILSHVWPNENNTDANIVWIYISYLREKLTAINADIKIIGEKNQDYHLSITH